jgi:hypothetical protein
MIRRSESFTTYSKGIGILKNIFSLETWSTTDRRLKLKTFNDFDDYKKIDAFYDSVKKREYSVLYDSINNETLLRYNMELSGMTNSVLALVANYADRFRTKKLKTIIFIASPIIIVSLILFYIFFIT